MSNVFFISDLHLGHKRILEFSPNRGGITVDEHDEWIVTQWNSVVQKRDLVWVLGDVCFDPEKLYLLSAMKGQKYLVRGNHDKMDFRYYLNHFRDVYGLVKKYGFWLSHAPVHPIELRGKRNIHGHVHNKSVIAEDGGLDERYINVCVEALNGVPMSLDQLRGLK